MCIRSVLVDQNLFYVRFSRAWRERRLLSVFACFRLAQFAFKAKPLDINQAIFSLQNEDVIENSRKQLRLLQKNLNEAYTKLKQCEESGIDVEEKEELKNFLSRTQENLEAEKKIFEDLEFQKLEYEAHREEERETLQRRLNIEKDIIAERIKLKKVRR